MKPGPEEETELFVYRVGVRGPGGRKSRSRDPEAGKGKKKSPAWLNQDEQGGSHMK